MYFKYLFLMIFLSIFAFANPPLKRVKPNAAHVAKNKGQSKLKPTVKPNKSNAFKPKAVKAKPEKPSKANAKPSGKNKPNEFVKPSDPKPAPAIKPAQTHHPKPDHKEPKEHKEAKPHKPHHPKHPNRNNNDSNPQPRRQTKTTSSSPGMEGGASLLGMLLGGCRPDSGARLSIGKSFGMVGNSAQTPLDGVTLGLGYRLLFLNLMSEAQLSGFSGTQFQAVKAHASINIPVGCFSISPLGGVGLISNNLIEGRTTTYDGGLMVEFHLIAPIAFGFRYLASMLQNDSKEILHSATFHFALYF